MAFPIVIAGLAGLGLLALASSKKSGPFDDVPADWKGKTPSRSMQKGKSGSSYVVDLFPPNASDEVFAVVQLEHFAGPIEYKPYSAWMSYTQNRGTGKRTLVKADAPGDATAKAGLIAVMKTDFLGAV